MAHVFTDRDAAHAIIDKCAGNGFTFLEIWREESLKSKPSDLALVTTLRDASYSRGVPGDLTFDSLNDALKEFLKLERACPPNVRKSDAEMVAFVNTAMLINTSTRSAYAVMLVRELLECLVVVHVHEHPVGRYEPPVARAARGRDHRFDAAPDRSRRPRSQV